MNNALRKQAIAMVTGLQVGFTTEFVVMENGEWRNLTAEEAAAVDTEYEVLLRVSIVPQSITKVQAMLQLKVLNLWDTFKAFLASNQDANDIWLLALSVDRDNSFVPIMAQVVGWDDVQTDNFFIEAVKL